MCVRCELDQYKKLINPPFVDDDNEVILETARVFRSDHTGLAGVVRGGSAAYAAPRSWTSDTTGRGEVKNVRGFVLRRSIGYRGL